MTPLTGSSVAILLPLITRRYTPFIYSHGVNELDLTSVFDGKL